MATETQHPTPCVSVEGALSLIAAGATLLDVREANEWNAGHAAMAIHIPLSMVGASLHRLTSTTPMVIVCRSGRRSNGVTVELCRDGFHAFNLEGGMQAWQAAGEAVVADGGLPGAVI